MYVYVLEGSDGPRVGIPEKATVVKFPAACTFLCYIVLIAFMRFQKDSLAVISLVKIGSV